MSTTRPGVPWKGGRAPGEGVSADAAILPGEPFALAACRQRAASSQRQPAGVPGPVAEVVAPEVPGSGQLSPVGVRVSGTQSR